MNDELGRLLTPAPDSFLEKDGPPGDAWYILFGAPLDATASYRSGSRHGPRSIREMSLYMESYSARTGLDWDDLGLSDAGDVAGMDSVEVAVGNVESVTRSVRVQGKFPIFLGGEHTVTLGALRALRPGLVVVFDAHLDLRDELFGERLTHATYLRRAHEEQGFRLAVIGARAFSREEIEYAEAHGITVVAALDVKRRGVGYAVETICKLLAETDSAYLSIDLDAVDPSEAPAVGNPSPEGISTTQLLDIIEGIVSPKFVGLDLTELSPAYDSGASSSLAAYILLEALYAVEKARRGAP